MPRTIAAGIALALLVAATLPGSSQTQPPFDKKHYNYAEWTKGRFSEAVVVSGPA